MKAKSKAKATSKPKTARGLRDMATRKNPRGGAAKKTSLPAGEKREK